MEILCFCLDLVEQQLCLVSELSGFLETRESCYKVILNSWDVIDKIASQPNGLSILSNKFNICYPLEHSHELKDYLRLLYNSAAQYSFPLVMDICKAIDGAAFGSDALSRIYGAAVVYEGNNTCKVNPKEYDVKPFYGWHWQICSEIVMLIGIGNSSMFQPKPFNFESYVKKCMKDFDVIHVKYCGGHNIKLVLQKFGSNIIFSNGLRDPYGSGGCLNDISDSLVELLMVNGTHCMDILAADEDDPSWLVEQRKKEVMIIHRWIREYYDELDANGI
ncbi:uncharacterized protein LOC127081884 [Lathyrus oleraceus]|uniref:uncharacterized protein LOC127081884 n=1 Tax=Pisum sativum TaxID=3888 RepID=UPI0021CEA00F|nr:uncharacterized protein LOC127081884 [Pisum sativum]